MPSLFISYRRADSPDTVKLLHERLKQRLPRWEIFYDHESIPLGDQFPDRLKQNVTSATAVLVIIGPKWVEILRERQSAAIDHVRLEVKLALESGASVVPVLVSRAGMPAATDLADFADLLPLRQRNAAPVRPDPDFDSDLEPIVTHLKTLDAAEAVGTILDDKYTLTAEIGDGGMGVVYAAQQKKPVQRMVAVKLIKPGMDSRDVLARFDAERQALAVMDHPNVAKVLDAGMTPHGRPYFVMEYVKGVPITQYCDEKKLTPHERLNLFIPVCNAVQHAHQKGIIHRDLKPSNVLVEVVDGKPVPKVIDFGLAKALGQKLTDKTLHTALEMRVGTLEYSAPEQAAGRSFDVDTRSDIYSLGVLLYELLTGAPPFTHEDLLKIGEEEMRRVIREVEPTTPSKKLSSSGELPAIAAKRHLEPGKLTRMVQGDLDWIVMKCLEKENARRYETANQLGQELERFLKDEPVQARPPSASYRMKKFLRRNKVPVVAFALVVLALVCGIIGTSIGFVQAEGQRAVAEANEKKYKDAADAEKSATKKAQAAAKSEKEARGTAEKEKAIAEKRLSQIKKTNGFLVSFFGIMEKKLPSIEDSKAFEERQNEVLKAIQEFLDNPSDSEGDDIDQVKRVQRMLANAVAKATEYRDPQKQVVDLSKLYAMNVERFGTDDISTLQSAAQLAQAYLESLQKDKAIPLYKLLIEKTKRPPPEKLAYHVRKLARAYEQSNELEKAIALSEPYVDLEQIKSAEYADTYEARRLASLYQRAHMFDKGIVLLEALRKVDDYDDYAFHTLQLGHLYLASNAPRKAIALFDDFLEDKKRRLGSGHPRLASYAPDIGSSLTTHNQHAAAEPLLRESLAISVKAQPDGWFTFDTKAILGASLLGQKKYNDAEPLLKEGYEGMKRLEKVIPPRRMFRLTEALERLVQLYDATGNAAEAGRWRKELAVRKAAQKEPKK